MGAEVGASGDGVAQPAEHLRRGCRFESYRGLRGECRPEVRTPDCGPGNVGSSPTIHPLASVV